jgi:hypothetical protein
MDIADMPLDECMEASECYIKELESRLQYTHSRAEREHIEFQIIKEKTIVNLMNRIEHISPHDIYDIPKNYYLEAICRLELINKFRDECYTKSPKDSVKTVKNDIKNDTIKKENFIVLEKKI